MPPPRALVVVVTGAAGLIGSTVAGLLCDAGCRVLAVDRLTTDQRFAHCAGLALADCLDADDFLHRLERERGLPRMDAVVHLGACSDTTERDAGYLLRNNFAYSKALATWCLRHGVRFVYASSAATYGNGEHGYRDALDCISRLAPLNAYAFSKHLFDLWALRAGALEGQNAIAGLKYFNVYGPHEDHKGDMRSMVLKAYEQILERGVVRLFRSYRPGFADGKQTRDFLHVDDAAAITVWFLQPRAPAGIFNVGSGVARSWNDLARAVFSAMGLPPRIEYIEMPEALRRAYQYSTCADISRLRSAGYTAPLQSLEAGTSSYIRWLQAQTDAC